MGDGAGVVGRIKAASLAAGLVICSGVITHACAAPADCPLEHARYVIRDEQGIIAGFGLRPPELFFFVRSPDRTAWFVPASGAALLVSTTDVMASGWRADGSHPLGDLAYAVTDADGRVMPDVWFHMGIASPAHILIPRLQDVLLYGAPSDSHEGLSLAFLDLDGCEPG